MRCFLLGLAGLPLDVRERIVKRGGETTEAVAAGCLGYEALEDYKMAYHYARKQREK